MKRICPNVGTLDAYIRITLGLLMLSCHTARRHPMLRFIGSMKIAEGITRFCPCLYLMKKDTKKM